MLFRSRVEETRRDLGISKVDFCVATGISRLDILFKEEKTELVKQALLEIDYQIYALGGHHDIYFKRPHLTVEMHRSCYSDNDVLNALFDTVWQRCTKTANSEYAYEMNIDDYYLFMVGHLAKHFIHGGIGIRMLLDFIIFEDKLEIGRAHV